MTEAKYRTIYPIWMEGLHNLGKNLDNKFLKMVISVVLIQRIFDLVLGILVVVREIEPYKSMYPNKSIRQPQKHDVWVPFKPLPNVRKFKVILSDWDKLFMKYGLKRRLTSAQLIYTRNDNNRLNRYMKHQLTRLEKNLTNPEKYWTIANHLMSRSSVFLVMSLNHVYPKWQREMNLSKVIRLCREVRKISLCPTIHLDSRRIYIQEKNKLRPIGVPSPAWRVYLHGLNQLLVKFLEGRNCFHEEQHGFRPGRGTKSAWESILANVIHSPNIFEFDLKGFFDNVSFDYINKKLIEYGIPREIMTRIAFIQACRVLVPQKSPFNPVWMEAFQELPWLKVINSPKALMGMYTIKGVPQGNPTSPVLASITLTDTVMKPYPNMKCLMYADDGIFYGDKIYLEEIQKDKKFREAGIEFNWSKSGWIKKNGIWLKPLKFLGLTFDGSQLKASTRKESKLVYDKNSLVHDYLMRSLYGESKKSTFPKSKYSWEELLKSRLFGFIQNRLYSGDWNLDEISQDFTLSFKDSSYVHKNLNQLPLTIFNSTSYASHWLVAKLRVRL